jgi:predicted RNA methylase
VTDVAGVEMNQNVMTKLILPVVLPVPKLISLDLFSGCGGLSCGLESAGLTKCKWAVEIDTKAADTFRLNFPLAKVYNEDVVDWFANLKV